MSQDPKTATEEALRLLIVAEALTWKGTPFHHYAAVKGAGVDCLHFIYSPFKELGLIPDIQIPRYDPQWFINRDENRLIEAIMKIGGYEVQPPPRPGDIMVIKIGRVFAHSAIVIDWPMVIHAHPIQKAVRVSNADVYQFFASREKKFFSYFPPEVKVG